MLGDAERVSSVMGAEYRIPDGLSHTAHVIQEVKNVKALSYSSQLQDFVAYAQGGWVCV